MEGEVEYLTEWPVSSKRAHASIPESSRSEDGTSIGGEQLAGGPSTKRRKHETAGLVETWSCALGGEELSLTRSDPSVLAGSLLARWWKLKLRTQARVEQSGSSGMSGMDKKVPSSNNPNTLLYHIAR